MEVEPWGEDPKLVEVLGAQGAAEFRAMLDGFPEAVGVLWAMRDGEGRIVDFSFGYGNPSILRAFRLPAATRDRYTLLEALPPMRGSRAFDAYIRVCETGEPFVHEVTYDTPFGDGYMLGTWVERSAKLGDGIVNFLTDVTEQRRMEAELRSYADVVAHDLNEPVAGIAMLVGLLERRAAEPPPAGVLEQLRTSTERARDLIDGVLVYARAGELNTERVALADLVSEVADDLRIEGAALEIGDLPEIDGDPRQLRRVLQNLLGNAVKYHGVAPLRIEVSALRDSREWVVTVRDNGLGVDPDQARPDLRHVLPRQPARRRRGDRPCRVPPHRRGPRRAHLGRVGRRRERVPLHPPGLTVDNAHIADRLDAFAALLELAEANPYTARAYRRAAETIRAAAVPVAGLVRNGQVRRLRGIGPGIEARLRELVETGEIAELTELERELAPELIGIGRYLGLGARRGVEIARALGVRTLDEFR